MGQHHGVKSSRGQPVLGSCAWPLSYNFPPIFILGKNKNRQLSCLNLRPIIWGRAFWGYSQPHWHFMSKSSSLKNSVFLESIVEMFPYVSVLNSGNLGRAQVQEIYENRVQFTPNFSPHAHPSCTTYFKKTQVLYFLMAFCLTE